VLGLGVWLDARFPEQVFWDRDTLEPGTNYRNEIKATLEECEIVIAVIGKEWLDIRDELGNRRLENEDDVLRLELRAALGRKIPIIPVLVGSAMMPNARDLPEDLKPLTDWNAMRLSADDPRGSYKKLHDVIFKLLEERKNQREFEEKKRKEEEAARAAAELKAKREAAEKAAAEERERKKRDAKPVLTDEDRKQLWGFFAGLAKLAIAAVIVYYVGGFAYGKYKRWTQSSGKQQTDSNKIDNGGTNVGGKKLTLNPDPYFTPANKSNPLGTLTKKDDLGKGGTDSNNIKDWLAKKPSDRTLHGLDALARLRFLTGGDTVSDLKTGLTWTKNVYELTRDGGRPDFTPDSAVTGADSNAVGGYKDWRVPTFVEYQAIDVSDYPSSFAVTHSLYATTSGQYYRFTNSGLTNGQGTDNLHYVRLVRGVAKK